MDNLNIAVIGLGYVGLPLAVELAKKFHVVGFDINAEKVEAYRNGVDLTEEVGGEVLRNTGAIFTSDEAFLRSADVFIVAVPTPIHFDHTPDLGPVISACRTVGRHLSKGTTIVFESTVYPGTTEEICIPILEETSGLRVRHDFHVGYSPERINPGDRVHTLTSITKIISATDSEALQRIDDMYSAIIEAGVYRAPSIKVAEAAKVIENAQRDINIAFMNELSIVFNKMEIDTNDVLKAASTKWNFMNFTPGLVGGHCIGVDPYYFIYKAEQLGYTSQIMAAGRKINDSMGNFIVANVVKELIRSNGKISDHARIGILGFTFKENCGDCRNTKVMDIVEDLKTYRFECLVHDPLADPSQVYRDYGITLVKEEDLRELDAVIIAVAHDVFMNEYPAERIRTMLKDDCHVIFDLKSIYSPEEVKEQHLSAWSL
ncbi:nucleotide sugar dehydrogenase [Bhargavaea cecembensis]|uniref:nucleotide sugar dehydrogenase n=1 Tax=Bhargavaea cecembensis TaxID=394098 RepID=UPI0009E3F0F5|nr:nucleotide sugar dehydrogenase [Bhargavaea cecembensis]